VKRLWSSPTYATSPKQRKRVVPYRLLLNQVYPLRTRVGSNFAYAELARHGLPLFRTALVERSAYREMFLNGQPPTITEPEKERGLEIASLLVEIRTIVDQAERRTAEGRLTNETATPGRSAIDGRHE